MPGKMGSFCRAGAAVKAGKGRKVPIGTKRRSPRCWAPTKTERFNTKLFLGGRQILSLFNKRKLSGAAGAQTKGAAGAKTKQTIKEKPQRCLSGSVDCMCRPTSWSAQATQNPSLFLPDLNILGCRFRKQPLEKDKLEPKMQPNRTRCTQWRAST